MKKNGKSERQEMIRTVLERNSIESQDELLQLLSEKGFELTQATLSRDFREMKIAKTPNSIGSYAYRLPGKEIETQKVQKHGISSLFSRNGIVNIEFSGQFVVLKTPKGYASGIAHDIDSSNFSEVMGTIAGYDTVLLILRENNNKSEIINSLKLLFTKE